METHHDTRKLDINCRMNKISLFAKRKHSVRNYIFRFRGEQIEIVDEYKCLGITLRYNGGFDVCQEKNNYVSKEGDNVQYDYKVSKN